MLMGFDTCLDFSCIVSLGEYKWEKSASVLPKLQNLLFPSLHLDAQLMT